MKVIEVLQRYVVVESTADESEYSLPPGVKNHGVLQQSEFQHVIEEAKVSLLLGAVCAQYIHLFINYKQFKF